MFGRLILGQFFKCFQLVGDLLGALLVRSTFFFQLLEHLQCPHSQAGAVIQISRPGRLALHKRGQALDHRVICFPGQQVDELLQQARLVLQHMIQEGKGETRWLLHGYRIQRLAGLVWQRFQRNSAADPIVHAIGEQLAAQYLGGLQENAWRQHLAGQHFIGVRKEIQVMRTVAIRQRRGEGVAITSPGAAQALQEAGLVGRHRT